MAAQHRLDGETGVDSRARKQLAQQAEVAQDPGDGDVGEDRVDQADVFVEVPLALGLVDQLGQRLSAEHDALVGTPGVVSHEIADGVQPHGLGVEPLLVVTLQISVPCHLPARAVEGSLLEDVPLVEVEGGDVGGEVAQKGVDVEGDTGGEADEHEAGLFGTGQRGEREVVPVDVAEGVGAEHAHQVAGGVVGPGVVGAAQPLSRPRPGLA